ncbi:anaerobic ribonucleoside-triphosphate reductase, partial [Bifidobacterium bifidum]
IEGEITERYNGPAKIEDIQNLVEHALIDAHLYDVARAYTNYRLDKDIQRAKATDVNEAVSRFINQDPTLIHENANKDANVYATQRDLLAGAVSKAAAFNMLPPAVANAHMKGDIHFHDADYSPFTAQSNCSLPNFWDMLANGFTLGNAPMASPKSIAIAATQITQIMKDVASSQYGGQTANRADEHLAAYAKKDYEKFLEEARETIPDGMPVEFARRQVENAKANEPAKLHFGSREPLPMDTPFHTDVDELEQEREILAKVRTRKSIYDAMQTMEYQINSNRVSNGQTPFVTVGFGLGTDWFAREVQRAILLNRIRGLGKDHHTAIFPKLVFTVRHGVNADPGDPNYDLKQLALECATKRMYPDVVFYENIVKITGSFKAPMGCRSFLQGWINPETGKDEEDGRMNLGVVSVNVPRIAIESHGSKERFWKLFNERMEVAHQALQFRIMRCKQATPVNAPTLFRFGAFGRLGASGNVDTLFKNERATVSLGYIGLAEATAVFYGKDWIRDHGWDPQGKEFALLIVKRMSELCKQWSKAEGYHYSVYSTPAESLTDRFNRMDREKFGRIEGVTDHDFYTNSFHYPVWLQPTPMEKLNYEKDFPYFASGGFINYCEYPCLQDNPKALEAVWDYAYNIGIGYLGTNTPIDHCFVCGFQGDFEPTDEGFKCPECGNCDPDKCNVTKRTCGYLGNPVQRPMVHGRHEEISHRVKHMSGETGHVTLADGSEREWFEEAK